MEIVKRGSFETKYHRFRLTCNKCHIGLIADEDECELSKGWEYSTEFVITYACPLCKHKYTTYMTRHKNDKIIYSTDVYKDGVLVEHTFKHGYDITQRIYKARGEDESN